MCVLWKKIISIRFSENYRARLLAVHNEEIYNRDWSILTDDDEIHSIGPKIFKIPFPHPVEDELSRVWQMKSGTSTLKTCVENLKKKL